MSERRRRYQLPSLNAFKSFEAVMRLGGIKPAAKELNLTSQAVSHQIRSLESQLGHELFERRARAMVPTPAATLLAGHVRQGLDRIAEGVRQLEQMRAARRLRLHVSPWFASHHLIPNLVSFTARHPQIDLQISIGAELSGFEDSVDIAILWGYGGWGEYEEIALVQDPKVLVASPGLLKNRPLEMPQDLLHHCLISPLVTNRLWRDVLSLWQLDFDQAASIMRFHTNEAMVDAALAGMGVGLISTPDARREVNAGRLVAPFGFDLIHRLPAESIPTFFMLYPKHHAPGELVDTFRVWLERLLRPAQDC